MLHPLHRAATAPLTALALIAALPAQGATTRTLDGGDFAFNDLCVAGSQSLGGSPNQACEFAVGEMRTGSRDGSGDWEVAIQNPPGSPTDEQQLAWVNGQAYAFVFAFSGETLTLDVREGTSTLATSTTGGVDLTGMESLFIRTRTAQEDFEGVRLSDMTLQATAPGGTAGATALPDVTSSAPGSLGAGYLQISDIDWRADWTLAGTIRFTWDPELACPCGSRLNVNFKLTDLETLSDTPAPGVIPLPAAGWLLLSGVVGLGWLGRRRAG